MSKGCYKESSCPKSLPDNMQDMWIERCKLERCCHLGVPAKINGMIVRVIDFSECFDPFAHNAFKIQFHTIPIEIDDKQEAVEINIDKLSFTWVNM